MSIYKDLQEGLEQYTDTVPELDGIAIYHQGFASNPPVKNPYVTTQLFPAGVNSIEIGYNATDQFSFIWQVNYFGLINFGMGTANEAADAIIAHFKKQPFIEYGDIRIHVTDVSHIGGFQEDTRNIVPVQVSGNVYKDFK